MTACSPGWKRVTTVAHSALGLLGLGRRAGTVLAGEDPARRAGSRAKLLLVSQDAGAHTVRWAQNTARPFAVLPVTKQELGAALGMRSCAVLAMTDAALALAVAKTLDDAPEALLARLERQSSRRTK